MTPVAAGRFLRSLALAGQISLPAEDCRPATECYPISLLSLRDGLPAFQSDFQRFSCLLVAHRRLIKRTATQTKSAFALFFLAMVTFTRSQDAGPPEITDHPFCVGAVDDR